MKTLTDLLDHSDLVSFGALVAILYLVGTRVAVPESAARRWGLRLALFAFVAYGVYGLLRLRSPDAGEIAALTFRGLFVAALTMGISWLLLPISGFFYRHAIAGPAAAAREAMDAARQRAKEHRTRRERELRRPAEEAERRRVEALAVAQAEQHRREQEERQRRQEAEQTKAELALRTMKDAARQMLRGFYDKHKKLLQDAYPVDLLAAFIRAEMPDSQTPEQLWKTCQDKIAQLLPLVEKERNRLQDKKQVGARRQVKLRTIDAEVGLCRQKIERLGQVQQTDLDLAAVEDERLGLELRIRELESQKELILCEDTGDDE